MHTTAVTGLAPVQEDERMGTRNHCSVARLDPARPVRRVLEWYYWDAESELGVRSSLGAALSRCEAGFEGGKVVQVDRSQEMRASVVGRHMRVVRAMRKLSPAARFALDATYEPHQWPAALTNYFTGDLVGIATRQPETWAAFREACGKKRARFLSVVDWLAVVLTAGSKEDREQVKALRYRADRRYREGHVAFAKEWECAAASRRAA